MQFFAIRTLQKDDTIGAWEYFLKQQNVTEVSY